MLHILTLEEFLLKEEFDYSTLFDDENDNKIDKSAPIYKKYYSNIDKQIFDKILKSDPTYIAKDNKMGIYTKWLLKLYTTKKLLLEDLYKAGEYLKTFNIIKHRLDLNKRDILNYSGLPELYKTISPFIEDTIFESEYERKIAGEFKEVFRNDKYRIIIPLTLKASQYFGRSTAWCTTHSTNFDMYTKEQDSKSINPNNLYIFYPLDEDDLDDRLQFSFKHRQFMDVTDSSIQPKFFFNRNLDIKNFFESNFDIDIFILDPDENIQKWGKDNNIHIYISKYENNSMYRNKEDFESKNTPIVGMVFSDFNYDDHYMGGSYTETTFLVQDEETANKFIDFLEQNYPNYEIESDDGEPREIDINEYNILRINI